MTRLILICHNCGAIKLIVPLIVTLPVMILFGNVVFTRTFVKVDSDTGSCKVWHIRRCLIYRWPIEGRKSVGASVTCR